MSKFIRVVVVLSSLLSSIVDRDVCNVRDVMYILCWYSSTRHCFRQPRADVDAVVMYQHHRSIILIVTIESYGGKRSS